METPQQFVRPKTMPDATSYSFPVAEATEFHVPRPARKIGRGRRALTGLQPSRKEVPAGAFESSLERDFFVTLEFDNRVAGWSPQPVKITVPSTSKYKSTVPYIPDVAVTWERLAREHYGLPAITLYEVKFREELKRRWTELRPKYKAAIRFAKERGWAFRIITEEEIRTDYLFNARFLLQYVGDNQDTDDYRRLWDVLLEIGPTTPSKLLALMSNDKWEQARILRSIWMMVALREIHVDLEKRLTMNSEIRHSFYGLVSSSEIREFRERNLR